MCRVDGRASNRLAPLRISGSILPRVPMVVSSNVKSSAPDASQSHSEASAAAPAPAAARPAAASVPADEALLIERAQGGDRAAFRLLYERYHRRAYAVALGVVRDPSDATDVVQDAFVKVYRHLGRFEGQAAFFTWLYRIVMNLSIDRLRRRKVHNVEFDERFAYADETSVLSAGSTALGAPVGEALRRELGQAIDAALDRLPEHHRAVLILREIEDLDYETIAQVLEIPKGTVMSRLFHARRKLQQALGPYLNDEQVNKQDRDAVSSSKAPSGGSNAP